MPETYRSIYERMKKKLSSRPLQQLWGAIWLGAAAGALMGFIVAVRGGASNGFPAFSLDALLLIIYVAACYAPPFASIAFVLWCVTSSWGLLMKRPLRLSSFAGLTCGLLLSVIVYLFGIAYLHIQVLPTIQNVAKIAVWLDLAVVFLFLLAWFVLFLAIRWLLRFAKKRIVQLLFASAVFLAIVCFYFVTYAIIDSNSLIRPPSSNPIEFSASEEEEPSEREEGVDSPIKVVFIGLDGLTWTVLDPLLEQGKLPNLSRLIDSGTRGNLETMWPTWTPIIWTTIATGKLPKKHGINFFVHSKVAGLHRPLAVKRMPELVGVNHLFNKRRWVRNSLLKSSDWQVPSVWQILSNYCKSVGIVGWVGSWPAQEVNGWLVSDRFESAAAENTVYPGVLRDELTKVVGAQDFKSRFASYPKLRKVYKADWINELVALHLLAKGQPDFLAIYLDGTDVVGHAYWGYAFPESMAYRPPEADIQRLGRAIEEYYRYADDVVGQLVETAEPNTIFIVASDHGMAAQPKLLTGYHLGIPSGNHNLVQPGVIILAGPHIRHGVLCNATVLDIAPTIVAFLGVPVAQDIDGRVITAAVKEGFWHAQPIQKVATYDIAPTLHKGPRSPEADDALIERLRELGYF